jgi:hypothetical protein
VFCGAGSAIIKEQAIVSPFFFLINQELPFISFPKYETESKSCLINKYELIQNAETSELSTQFKQQYTENDNNISFSLVD